MNNMPADWAIRRALELIEIGSMWSRDDLFCLVKKQEPSCRPITAFARYIEKHENPPVNPDVLAVREILSEFSQLREHKEQYLGGVYDNTGSFHRAVLAYRRIKGSAA